MNSFDPLDALRSFVTLIRQMFRRNYGPFVVALICVAVASGAGVAVVTIGYHEIKSTSTAVSELLNTEFLPSRRKDHLAVAAAAIRLVDQELRRLDANLTEPRRKQFEVEIESWLRGKLPTLKILPVHLIPCPDHKSLTEAQNPFVFVPEQVAPQWRAAADGGPIDVRSIAVIDGARRASAWTEVLRELMKIPSPIPSVDFAVIQVYYVSWGGVLMSLSRSNEHACDTYKQEDGYSLIERPYMIAARDRAQQRREKKEVESDPDYAKGMYIDASGQGIVGTTCVADRDVESGEDFGLACADYQPVLVKTLSGELSSGLLQATVAGAPNQAAKTNDTNKSPRGVLTGVSCDSKTHACKVPLATSEGKWLEMRYKQPKVWPLRVFGLLALLAAIAVVYFARIASAWRTVEARLGMLRDLPAGILHVERGPNGIILAASDRAEELLQRQLPSFVVPNPGHEGAPVHDKLLFWNVFDPRGFSVDESGLPEWDKNLIESVAALRAQGISSTYWVCFQDKDRSTSENWLEIVGNPELFATSLRPISFVLVVKPDPTRLRQALGGAPWNESSS